MKVGKWDSTMVEEEKFWKNWIDKRINEKGIDPHTLRTAELAIIERILAALDIEVTDDTKVLEIGTGVFGVIHSCSRGHLYVCDPLWTLYEEARAQLSDKYKALRNDVTLLSLMAEDIPKDSGPFDIVLAINSLDHCKEPSAVVERIAATTREGALFFEATSVWGEGVQDPLSYGTQHPHLYIGNQLREVIAPRGFQEIKEPLPGISLYEEWAKVLGYTSDSWPCYLRVWRRRCDYNGGWIEEKK